MKDLENEDVYEHRDFGQKKPAEWRKEKCVSCKVGFNSRSNPVKYDGCDKYTHKKTSCLKETQENSQFLCQLCAPNTEYPHEKETHKGCKWFQVYKI